MVQDHITLINQGGESATTPFHWNQGKLSATLETLRGGKSEGVDQVRIDTGAISFTVLPTRGMSLWKATCGELELGWNSPNRGPVHPAFVPISEPSGLGWLSGFDEMMVRCGLESNGAPVHSEQGALLYPVHGRIANLPAHLVTLDYDAATETLTLTGVVEETRFLFLNLRMTSQYIVKAGESKITIRDTVENLSESATEIQMLYHTNFGANLLDAGSQLVAPAKTIVPRNEHAAKSIDSWSTYLAPQAGFEEQVYFFEMFADEKQRTQCLLKNGAADSGVSLSWQTENLPWFAQWKNTAAGADGYVTGLEPTTNFPNPRPFEGEKGRTVKLAGGAKTSFDLAIEPHTTADQIVAAEEQIEAIRGGHEAKVFREPQADWCA